MLMGKVKDYRDGFKEWLERPPVRTSFVLDGTCKTCEALAKGEMCPPHDASPRCESGKRNHCTCDTCF
jgi:hypothetical protein